MSDKVNFLYEEETFVVIEKVSGFLAVPGRGPENFDCVTERVKQKHSECIAHPAVHRLDMDTSGLMVVALTKETHRNLSIQFQERQTRKRYEALLDGIVEEDEGSIELPFRLDVDNRPHQIYDEEHGKMGLTHWQKIVDENGCSRLSLIPITGRTHQLRLHTSHEKGLGIPIMGDPLYGNTSENGQLKLHACFLSFQHPLSGKKMNFESVVPF
jgi:tRNA pseudouridine32 synthase / 23S rRNA pseudouridine746 synthase